MTKLLPALPMLVMAATAVVFVWRGFDDRSETAKKREKWKRW